MPRRRRMAIIRPIAPIPAKATVDGSGTAANSLLWSTTAQTT
jgi:hypothetical protein